MFKKVALWRGLAGLFLAIMMLAIFASLILTDRSGEINKFFNVATSEEIVLDPEEAAKVDSEYFKSTFGALNAENLGKLEAAAYAQTVKEAEEGAVLLKNENGALPLKPDETKVSLFGQASYAPLYNTAASTTKVISKNSDLVVDMRSALSDAGFNVNPDLYDAFGSSSLQNTRKGYSHNAEQKISFYEGQSGSFAEYNHAAIVMLKREAGEGVDMSADQSKLLNGSANTRFEADDVKNSLALQTRERAMMELIKNSGFGKIIVLINTNYQMELGWLDEYNVDACLFIGTPGLTGLRGIANILKGDANPSGRLVSTFASNSLSSPAIVNAATNTPKWSNWEEFDNRGGQSLLKDNAANTDYVTVQQENIYVDYKYYESRYADAVMGDAGAKSNVGSSDGGAWSYTKEMCYPFGFGLSYTTFDQTIEDVAKNDEDNIYTVKVNVKNTGSEPGKCAVLLYVNTPYGAYEKGREIEKPSILFVGFNKTQEIEVGKTVTVEVEVEEYLFASYDMTDGGGYVLTEGDYYFAVGNGAHEALNNILAVQDYTGLSDHNGAVTITKADVQAKTHKFKIELDETTYKYGEDGKTEVVNQFEKMDINHWGDNNINYLTRKDWSGTFPIAPAQVKLQGTEMVTLLQGDYYQKGGNEYLAAPAESTDGYAQGKNNKWEGVDNGRLFVSMRHFDYTDEQWDKFIDQFSLDELAAITGNDFGNKGVGGYINIPERNGGDGCQGVGGGETRGAFAKKYTGEAKEGDANADEPGNLNPCMYTSLLACTFNKELIENRGTLMGNESLYLRQTVIWTGGANLHRTPYGGRQAEYYSADANLSYLIGAIEMPAMEKLGILGGIKHFAGNDQESYREGVSTFYTEQSLRENALRGFEGALRKGKVKAVMSAFNRQGVKYSSSCPEFNITVLREEWGFVGHVITDASSGATTGYKSHYTTSISTGTDLYCLDSNAVGGNTIAKAIRDNDDGYLLGRLRLAAKNISYALSRSAALNGITDFTRINPITPLWQIMMYVGMGICIALAAAAVGMFAVSKLKTTKRRTL